MTSLSKIIATVTVGTLLAAGSAVALLTPGGDGTDRRDGAAVPYSQGFAAGEGWNCGASGSVANAPLTFEDRWNGHGRWQPTSHTMPQTSASCANHWAHAYLNTPNTQPSTVANARRIDLSTLPLMR